MSIVEKGGVALIQWWFSNANKYSSRITKHIHKLETLTSWWKENTCGFILWHFETFLDKVDQHTQILATNFQKVTENDIISLRSSLNDTLHNLDNAMKSCEDSFKKDETLDGDVVIPINHKQDPFIFLESAKQLIETCYNLIEDLMKFT